MKNYLQLKFEEGFWSGVIRTIKSLEPHLTLTLSSTLLDANNKLQKVQDDLKKEEEKTNAAKG